VAHPQDEDEHESDARQRGEQTLNLLAQGLRDKGVSAESVMLFADDIAKALLNTAKARGCTLIVVGLTGKSMFQRLLGGDVSANLTRHSEIPVLLCPPAWTSTV